jgi:hypothetical protein
MAGKDKKAQVRTTWDFLESIRDPVVLAGGFTIPSELNVSTESSPGVHVEMHVVVEAATTKSPAKARTDSVTVQTHRRGGIGLDVLRGISVRNIMATALLDALHKVEVSPDGSVRFAKVGGTRDAARSEEIREVVQGLVGWVRA